MRQKEAQRFLVELGPELSGSLECAPIIRSFARLAVGRFADLCVVRLCEDECCAARLEMAHRDARLEALAQAELTPDIPLLAETIATGQASMLREKPTHGLPRAGPWTWPAALLPRGGSCIAVPLMARGRPLGAALFISSPHRRFDRTDLDLAHEAARRVALAVENARLYAAAKRALQAHDDVVSFVSHDLRNPLNVVAMAAELLLERSPPSDEEVRRWLTVIVRSAAQMERLLSDLLTAARSTTGRLVPSLRPAPVDLLLREAAEMSRETAERKGLRLVVRPPEAPLEACVDVDLTVRALSNLIGNAVKFTEHGSVTVSAEREGDDILFHVADTGCGIAPEHIPHIFERFWQPAGGESRGGAGLGLAIVKAAVEAHGGRIWVDSRPAKGSTFHFALPLGAEDPGDAEEEDAEEEEEEEGDGETPSRVTAAAAP